MFWGSCGYGRVIGSARRHTREPRGIWSLRTLQVTLENTDCRPPPSTCCAGQATRLSPGHTFEVLAQGLLKENAIRSLYFPLVHRLHKPLARSRGMFPRGTVAYKPTNCLPMVCRHECSYSLRRHAHQGTQSEVIFSLFFSYFFGCSHKVAGTTFLGATPGYETLL